MSLRKIFPSAVEATRVPSALQVGCSSSEGLAATGSNFLPLRSSTRRMSLPLVNTTCGWPTETSSFTLAPLATLVPPGGSVANSVVGGESSKRLTTSGTMPRSAAFFAYSSVFSAAIAGTMMSFAPPPAAAPAPPAAAAPPPAPGGPPGARARRRTRPGLLVALLLGVGGGRVGIEDVDRRAGLDDLV